MKHRFGCPQLHGWRTADFPQDLASGAVWVPPSPAVPCAPCHGSVAFHRRLFVSCPPPGCDDGRRCLACSLQGICCWPFPVCRGGIAASRRSSAPQEFCHRVDKAVGSTRCDFIKYIFRSFQHHSRMEKMF